MKYDLREHPYIFMVLVALVLLALSILIAYLYEWNGFAIIAIVLSGLGLVTLSYTFFKDLSIFLKQKKEMEQEEADEKNGHE